MTIDDKFINKQVQLFMCLKRVEIIRKSLQGCEMTVITFENIQKQLPEVLYKKAVLLKLLQYSHDEQENSCIGVSLKFIILQNF